MLFGGVGNDIILGDIGYSIRRYDENGAPILNSKTTNTASNYVWHKDIVLEELGSITAAGRISTKVNTQRLTAERVAESSLLFVAAAYQDDGIKFTSPIAGGWIHDLLMFSLVHRITTSSMVTPETTSCLANEEMIQCSVGRATTCW